MDNDVQPREPIIEVIRTAMCERGDHEWYPLRLGRWLEYELTSRCLRQGWKLHVSADVTSAIEVLERCLPTLLTERANFKVANSLEVLGWLNQGQPFPSQVGKFITVYPGDDAHAVRLAVALHFATRGLTGPVVPSDRRLAPGSLVYYRYGAFSGKPVTLDSGEITSLLEAPHRRMILDRRGASYWAPDWATDPFQGIDLDAERPTIVHPSPGGPIPEPPVAPKSRRHAVNTKPLARHSRVMTDDERAKITRLIEACCRPDLLHTAVCLLGLPVLGLLVPLLILALLGIPLSPTHVIMRVLGAGALAGLLLGVNAVYQNGCARRDRVRLLRRDRSIGLVDVLVGEVTRAAAISAQPRTRRDMTLDLVLETGPSELLFLNGRHLDRARNPGASTAGRSPGAPGAGAARIVVDRLPCSGEVIGVKTEGAPFPIIRSYTQFQELSGILRDGEVIQGSLSTLDRDLLQLAEKRRSERKARK